MNSGLKRLHSEGFALHALKPKSKMPIGAKWSSGPRLSWEEFVRAQGAHNNVGVRLGLASKFADGTYLAVIDCDVKSAESRHLVEMEKKLKELGASNAPTVMSGRGNGSRHLYVRTKAPASSMRFAQSSEKVRVHMPSVGPSRYETDTLDARDVKKGVRLRAAWEISIMGEGGQVVLPPSIHPDSGKAYRWAVPFTTGAAPLVAFKVNSKSPKAGQDVTDFKAGQDVTGFKAVEVDLVSGRLDSRVVDLILSGKGCEDRSAALFAAAIAMVRARYSDTEILSVLTDRENFLGEAAYEHANTTSRGRAAAWVARYTLEKAKRETSAEHAFSDEALVEDVKLDAAAAKEQEEEILGEPATREADWRGRLERGGPGGNDEGKVKNTFLNVYTILKGEAGDGCIRRNEFANVDVYGADTPWGGKKGRELGDTDTVLIKHWLATHYRTEPSDDKIIQACVKIAHENRFHPVRDYIDNLTWDGCPRVDHWLKTYLGAYAPEPYLGCVSRKVLCAMIARVYEPGCKYDQILILEGKQGCGKSTAVRILADPWFSDAHLNIADKDAVLTMRSVWVLEMGELSGMRKVDVDSLKEFISQQKDRIRNPYGRKAEDYPRQCVFIGTTNNDEYLKDATGNRRFWPVKVQQCDFVALKRDRDQLLAEAKFLWESCGEKLFIDDAATNEQAMQEQEDRTFHDALSDDIADFFENEPEGIDPRYFTIQKLMKECPPCEALPATMATLYRVGNALRTLGYAKKRMRTGGRREIYWVHEASLATLGHSFATLLSGKGGHALGGKNG